MQPTAAAVLVSALIASPVALAQDATKPRSPAGTVAQQAQPSANAAAPWSDEERERAGQRLGVGAGKEPDRAGATMRQISVDDLEDMDVYNHAGERVGEVEEVVSGPGGRPYVVVSEGGFFGIGEDEAVLPLERMWIRDDDSLVIYGVTAEDIESMSGYRDNRGSYTDLEDTTMLELPFQQKA